MSSDKRRLPLSQDCWEQSEHLRETGKTRREETSRLSVFLTGGAERGEGMWDEM